MSPKGEEKKLLKELYEIKSEITELRKAINKVELSSFSSTEDQLFVGCIFTLAILALTFPSLNLEFSLYGIGFSVFVILSSISIQTLVAGALLTSAVVRYVSAITKSKVQQGLRGLSVAILIFIFNLIAFMVLSGWLGQWLTAINPWYSYIPLILLLSIYCLERKIERNWYRLYSLDVPPVVSIAYASFPILFLSAISLITGGKELFGITQTLIIAAFALSILPTAIILILLVRLEMQHSNRLCT